MRILTLPALKCLPSSDRPGLSCPRGWVILKSVRDVRMIRHPDLLLLIHWMRLPILFWFSSMRKRISSRYWDSWREFIKWNWMEPHLWSGSWSMTVTSFHVWESHCRLCNGPLTAIMKKSFWGSVLLKKVRRAESGSDWYVHLLKKKWNLNREPFNCKPKMERWLRWINW